MNPLSILIPLIRVAGAFRPTTPIEEPEAEPVPVTKRRGRTAPTDAPVLPRVVKRNWRPLVVAAATLGCIGLGLYSGQIDGASALSMLATIDLNGVLALFGG